MQACHDPERVSEGRGVAPDPHPPPPPIPYTSKGKGHHSVAKQTELVPTSWKVNDEPLWWKRRVRTLPGCCPSPASVLGLFTQVTWWWTHGPWGLWSCPPGGNCEVPGAGVSSLLTHVTWTGSLLLPPRGPCPYFSVGGPVLRKAHTCVHPLVSAGVRTRIRLIHTLFSQKSPFTFVLPLNWPCVQTHFSPSHRLCLSHQDVSGQCPLTEGL